MRTKTKTDHHNLQAKLDLRRQLLRELPQDKPLSVCDCFSGGEIIWSRLRQEFNIGEYLALDIKRKDRRLRLDSLRYLQGQRWTHDVIDLDAYGSPWKHWLAVLARRCDCLVFLTIGSVAFQNQTQIGLRAIGLTFSIPIGLHSGLKLLVDQALLAEPLHQRFSVPVACEALNPGGNARYIGMRMCWPRF